MRRRPRRCALADITRLGSTALPSASCARSGSRSGLATRRPRSRPRASDARHHPSALALRCPRCRVAGGTGAHPIPIEPRQPPHSATRGFLPRGLANACPCGCAVIRVVPSSGRRRPTLNDCSPSFEAGLATLVLSFAQAPACSRATMEHVHASLHGETARSNQAIPCEYEAAVDHPPGRLVRDCAVLEAATTCVAGQRANLDADPPAARPCKHASRAPGSSGGSVASSVWDGPAAHRT